MLFRSDFYSGDNWRIFPLGRGAGEYGYGNVGLVNPGNGHGFGVYGETTSINGDGYGEER